MKESSNTHTTFPEIDFLQAWGIILVVLGHAIYVEPKPPLFSWIYGFHMPLFFFISGYLLRATRGAAAGIWMCGKGGFLHDKARRLLVPYFVLSTLLFVPKTLTSSMVLRPLEFSWQDYLYMLFVPHQNVVAAYWFMPTIFGVFILAILLAKCLRKCFDRYPLGVLLPTMMLTIFTEAYSDSFLNAIGMLHFLFYFLLGYFYERSSVTHWIQRQALPICPIAFLLSIAGLWCPDFVAKDLLLALNGIAMSLAMAYIYVKGGYRWLQHLKGASYTIYLYSVLFQIACIQVLLHYVDVPPYVVIPLAFFSGLYGSLLIYRFIMRHSKNYLGRTLAWISGIKLRPSSSDK